LLQSTGVFPTSCHGVLCHPVPRRLLYRTIPIKVPIDKGGKRWRGRLAREQTRSTKGRKPCDSPKKSIDNSGRKAVNGL
jgi:hypothetical protein